MENQERSDDEQPACCSRRGYPILCMRLLWCICNLHHLGRANALPSLHTNAQAHIVFTCIIHACPHICVLAQILNTILIVVTFTHRHINSQSEKCKAWSGENNPTIVILILLSSVASLTFKLSKIVNAPTIWQMLKELQMEE